MTEYRFALIIRKDAKTITQERQEAPMAVMDEFKEERQALKKGTLKEKIAYFWYYYKWHTIAIIAAVVFIVAFARELLNQKEDAFYGAFVNAWELETAADYIQGFADTVGIDTNEYDVMIDSSLFISNTSMDETTMAAAQKLMVYTAAQEIDVMVSDSTSIEQYANNETFSDLRTILSEEQLEKYEPYFYYIDQSVVDEKNEALDNGADNYVPDYPDPRKPEEMVNPIPVGIYVDSCQGLMDSYVFKEESVVLGVVVNTTRPETALAFLDYLFETSN